MEGSQTPPPPRATAAPTFSRPRSQVPFAATAAPPGAPVAYPPIACARRGRSDIPPNSQRAPLPPLRVAPRTRTGAPTQRPPSPPLTLGAPDTSVEHPLSPRCAASAAPQTAPHSRPPSAQPARQPRLTPPGFLLSETFTPQGRQRQSCERQRSPRSPPPATPVPRHSSDPATANPWPPGWEARRPIAIEDLFIPGVYAALEVWLADGEVQMLDAVIASQLRSHLGAWQETCRQRRRSLGAHPQPRSPNKGNTYTIPAADLIPGAEAFIGDTTDRHPCDVTMRALTRGSRS